MDKLPTQLRWAQFVRVLEKLGYRLSKNLAGSGRTFIHQTRIPQEVSFHEPHRRPIPNGTLTEYLHKLKLSRKEFFSLLNGEESGVAAEDDDADRFKHYTGPDGLITSVCSRCFEKVSQSFHLHEVENAEAVHPCYLPEIASAD